MSGLKIETKICENWSQQQLRDPLYITVPDFMKLVQPLLRYGNFSFFFNMAAAGILDFQKLEILMVRRLQGPICITRPNFVKSSQTVVWISQFNGFSKWWAFWTCWTQIWTTHVPWRVLAWCIIDFIMMQNLAGIDAVVLIMSFNIWLENDY